MAKHTLPKRAYRPETSYDTSNEIGRAKLWHERLTRSDEMLDISAREERAEAGLKYIDGSYAIDTSGNVVYLNEGLPAIEDVIFGTVPGIPSVDVVPRQPEQEDLARKCGALVDGAIESDLVRAKAALVSLEWDDIKYGFGVARMGWHQDEHTWNYRPTGDEDYLAPHVAKAEAENDVPESAELAEEDDHLVHIQLHEQLLLTLPEGPDKQGMADHNRAHWSRMGTKTWAHPVINRIDPMRFRYDPDAQSWPQRRWEAELCDEYVYDLQQIPGIKHLTKENCPSLDNVDAEDAARIGEEFDYENQRVKVWKIHDRINKRWIILPYQQGTDTKPILEDDWPFGALDIYGRLVHRPIPGQLYGLATLHLIGPILHELAKVNAVIRKHLKRAAAYKMLLARKVDPRAKKEIENANKAVAHVDPAALSNAKEFKPPSLPPEVLEYRDLLLTELRRLLGSDIMNQGGETPHAITASEAQLRGSYQESRLLRRQQDVSEFLGWLAYNVILLYRDFADDQLMVRVMGPQGAEITSLSPAAIPDDLLVSVDVEAISPARRQQKMLEASEWTEIVSKIAPGLLDPVKTSVMLGDAYNIPNPEGKFLKPEEQGAMPMPGSSSQPGEQPMENMSQTPEAPSVPKLSIAQ